jgi:hypothetical protein
MFLIKKGESWSRRSLYSYFNDELKERPVKKIVEALVLGEATDDEINTVASLHVGVGR